MTKWILVIGTLLFFGALAAAAGGEAGEEAGTNPNDWLLNADSDNERFGLLQRYLRGFDQPMLETGVRFEALYEALKRENFALAEYHWEKIRTTIRNGYLKRPKRQANADRLFLDETWGEVRVLLAAGDADSGWRGFEEARRACMRCHVAEDVAYMNDQPLFELEIPGQTMHR